MTLIDLLYKVTHKHKRYSFEQIAESIGAEKWSLYKMVNPNEFDYRFPLIWLIPLMRMTGDFSLLHHIASRCGYVCLPYKSYSVKKRADLGRLNELFGLASQVIEAMYNTGKIDEKQYNTIYDFLAEVAGHLKAAEKIRRGQLEMF